MSATDVQIASQALTLLRANTISRFSEGTNEADIVTELYPTFVEDVLSRYPWSFATKKRQLNRDADTPVNEWKYRYILPAERLNLTTVFNTDAVGARPVQDFEIIGNYLYTNYEKVYAEYTFYAKENTWPGYFKTYAIYALADLLAIPVTDDVELKERMKLEAYGPPSEGERGGKFAVAAGIDAKQKPAEELWAYDVIAARFS